MIEALAAVAVCIMAVGVVRVATRTRRRMQRHPVPTFVFADLAGYRVDRPARR